jgi:L-amino acid N-acyltransferase YncA
VITIRTFAEEDWQRVWHIMQPVIRAGETYPYARDLQEPGAREFWLDNPQQTYVAIDADGHLVGTYYIKPNQPALGAHVANCGYIVDAAARGRGVATAMCEHSQMEAIRLGYRAMQYSLVIKTNAPSVHLWQKLGFTIVGTLPGAFNHAELGYVDAYVMYKILVS